MDDAAATKSDELSAEKQEAIPMPNEAENEEEEAKAEEEEDDDDFGDFEEAAAPIPQTSGCDNEQAEAKIPPELVQSTSGTSIQQLHSICFRLPIARLAREPELWQCHEVETGDGKSEDFHCRQLPTPCNLFPQMDAGSSSVEGVGDDETMERALRFWTSICYVEEAAALQFRWDTSRHSQKLLWALHLRQKGRTKKFPPEKVQQQANENSTPAAKRHEQIQQPSTSSNNSSAHQPTSTSSAKNPTPAPEIDSLMVPPADFDWRSSGLANPLTGKAVSSSSTTPANTFDCNFLLDGQSSSSTNGNTGTGMNSTSILAKDLLEFGLVSNDKRPVENGGQKASQNGPSQLDVGKLVDGLSLAGKTEENGGIGENG